ncbi:MAG: hypothetical protein LJE67_12705 [Salaquimonas sp.]|nr:hypothetical protein [Salaquimonas sp.]
MRPPFSVLAAIFPQQVRLSPDLDAARRSPMARGLAVLALMVAIFVVAHSGEAEARPDTRRMSCAQAQGMVRGSGAVVMTYGQNLYNRFVDNRGLCGPDEETATRRVPTTDTPKCPLLYCRPNPFF